MRLPNSSGLSVNIDEATPTIAGGSNPFWASGSSVMSPSVAALLPNSQINRAGFGWSSLEYQISGRQGAILVTYIAGPPGTSRTLAVLTDDPTLLSNRIVLTIDSSNRPGALITNAFGAVVAAVSATYSSIDEGTHVTVVLSWDSTQAINGLSFAKILVQANSVPSTDWVTIPVATWTHFMPTSFCTGYGLGIADDFNGQIISFQASNSVCLSLGAGTSATDTAYTSTHIWDRDLSEVLSLTEGLRTDPPVYSFALSASDTTDFTDTISAVWSTHFYKLTLDETSAVTDSLSVANSYGRNPSDASSVSDSLALAKSYGRSPSDASVVSDSLAIAYQAWRILSDTIGSSDQRSRSLEAQRTLTTDTISGSDTVTAVSL